MSGRWLAISYAILAMTALLLPTDGHAAVKTSAPSGQFSEHITQDVCIPTAGLHDIASERRAVVKATAVIAEMHRRQTRTLEGDHVGLKKATFAQLAKIDRIYSRQRLNVLRPLAASGNSEAIWQIAIEYGWTGSEFSNHQEFLRLQRCAADLGNTGAEVEMLREYWHDTGGGIFEKLLNNRRIALDFSERAASQGDFGGIASIGVYIGAGRHLYPINPELGRRILRLCARAGVDACKERLVEQEHPFAVPSNLEMFSLLRNLSSRQPELYARRLDEIGQRLTESERAAADVNATRVAPIPWKVLEPEWRLLRAEIDAGENPCELRCSQALPCTCPLQ